MEEYKEIEIEDNKLIGKEIECLPENIPAADDDLLGQAKDAGSAAIDFGKKTGRFALNLLKKGMEYTVDQAEKQKKLYDKKRAEFEKNTEANSE